MISASSTDLPISDRETKGDCKVIRSVERNKETPLSSVSVSPSTSADLEELPTPD